MPDLVDPHRLCESAKSAARSRILGARRRVAAPDRPPADAALCATLRAAVRDALLAAARGPAGHPPGAQLVAGYVPMAGEPGGAGLPDALADGIAEAHATIGGEPAHLILPVLRADNDLDWARHQGSDQLRPAARGLREPAGPRLGRGAIATATLVVAPAVAVDRTGLRLGRGGGSYDRALARAPEGVAVLVPLYRGEFVDQLPAAPHDQRVTTVVVADGATVTVVEVARR